MASVGVMPRCIEDAADQPTGLQIALPATHGRVLGHALGRQLFFPVCAMKPLNCGTILVPLHFGHVGLAFSRSEMVMMSSKDFLHFSQRNS
jgi:hypothetical protein